ncbi:MAG: YihY/virulence factor BrkB family protein, partial [Bdellovibrio sp.]|nr:YihY/virulence factor BrkB family protein [Bdellovibrio sp.]
ASLSYYTTLSLAPLLILLLTFVAFVDQSFRDEVLKQTQGLIGSQARDLIKDIAANVDSQSRMAGVAGMVGVVTLLFSAGAIFGELRMSLNKIFQVDKSKLEYPNDNFIQSTWRFLKDKLFNMGMVLAFVFISIVSLLVSSGLSFFLKGDDAILGQALNFLVSLGVFGLLFGSLYYFLPQTKVSIKVAVISGVITGILFSIGKSLIGLYLGQSAVGSMYGAAGSLIVVLVWVYYSSAVIFVSAEIANEICKEEKNAETC